MQAKCPNCETIFRLTDQQLSAAHGKVRCGLCHSIFTATSIDEEETPPVVFSVVGEPSNSSIDTFSNTRNIESNETPSDSQDILLDDFETNPIIPDEFRHSSGQSSSSHLATLSWSIGILFLLVTLISEYAWFNRNQLVQNADIEPWITQFCATTGCTLDPIHKPELIKMVNRNVYTHPNIKEALMITATMVNTAPKAQAYPGVKIGFSNVRGEIVTQRTFSPAEYMKIDQKQLRLLQPDTPVTFGLEIKDPGKQAMTYEFNFI